MAVFAGPEIVNDGLILSLDAANSRSYTGTGTVWNDLSGNGNNYELVNSPSFNGPALASFILDGVDDSITRVNALSGLTSAQMEGSLTYEYWLQPTATIKSGMTQSNSGSDFYSLSTPHPQGLGGKTDYNYGATNSIYVGLGFAFGTNGFILGVHKNSYAPHILVDYQNYSGISHLVVIKNTLNCSYYVNGVFKKTSATISNGATIIGDNMTKVTAITTPFTKQFKGNIFKVNFYNRALTAIEIQQNFEAIRGRYGI